MIDTTHALLLGDDLATHNGRVITGTPDEIQATFSRLVYRLVRVPAAIEPRCSVQDTYSAKERVA